MCVKSMQAIVETVKVLIIVRSQVADTLLPNSSAGGRLTGDCSRGGRLCPWEKNPFLRVIKRLVLRQ